jgi:hypothetical protein
LQATALINEAYLRLAHDHTDWNSREHFMGVTANTMRRVLVDDARAHKAEQRGGRLQKVELKEELVLSADKPDEEEWLHETCAKGPLKIELRLRRQSGGSSSCRLADRFASARAQW